MQDDEALKNVWHFWNHNFYSRTKPVRKIPTKGKGYGPGIKIHEVICHDCGKTIPLNDSIRRKAYFQGNKNPKDRRHSTFLCKKCYKINQEELKKEKKEELKWYREEKVIKFIDSVEKFDDLMSGCEYNTCDILAAHRELLKDDDNRLHTDFMLGLICGNGKRKKYLEMKNNEAK